MLVPIALVVAVSLPFLVALAVQPITRRMALRYPRRRPVEALLVVVGSLLGTSIITGSLIVGDTIDRSIVSIAYDQLGPIDELVTIPGLDTGEAFVERLDSLDAIPGSEGVLDGVLPIVTTPVSVVGDRVQPRAQLVEVDPELARSFGDDPEIVGIPEMMLAPGTVAITTDLATAADAAIGDEITVFVYGVGVPARVTSILPGVGVAGFWDIDGRQQSYNVLVAPGTVAAGLDGVELPASVEPPTTHLAFSNVGGVEDGADGTGAATEVITTAVSTVADDLGVDEFAVRPVKREQLAVARSAADSQSDLYLTMGMFSVAAGILLLVNIFVMLADERRSQLGMLRAIGMRRRSVVMAFATEGWLYALVSAAIGAVLGIGLGRVIAWRADQILSTGDDLYTLDLTFAWGVDTVVDGFAIGLAISVATVVLTSVRISRLNVLAAIRDLPVTTSRRQRRWTRAGGTVTLAGGLVWTAVAVASSDPYGIMAGPMIVAAGSGAVLAQHLGPRATTTFAAIVVLVWGMLCIPVLGWLDIQSGIPIFLVQGLTMCAAAVALVMVHHKALGVRISSRFGGAIPVRVGLAYPLARAFRTAMTLGMFAIVVLTIVYLAFISIMFRQQVDGITDDLSGGFGVVVTSNPANPVTDEQLRSVAEVGDVAPLMYGIANVEVGSRAGEWPITGFGPELAAAPPALSDRGSFGSDAAAWAAVLADPDLVIADEFILSVGGPEADVPAPGDEMTIADPSSGTVRTVEIAALATPDWIANGVFYGNTGYRELFGPRAVESRFYVAAVDLAAAADEISGAFTAQGADADVVRDQVEALLAQNTGFFTLMQQFVGVGLLVGIAGLGVQMVRSVRERRRDIGVLRSLGVEHPDVSRSFLLEATVIAWEGVVIGIVVAVVGSYGLVLSDTGFLAGLEWALPWRDITTVALVTIVAAAVTAWLPARTAGRIRPAEALRIAD